MYDISKKLANIIVIIIVLSFIIYLDKRNKQQFLYTLTKDDFETFETKNNIKLKEDEQFIKPEEILEEKKKELASNSLFDIKTIKDFSNNKFTKDSKNLTQMNCKYFNLLDDKLNRDLVPRPGELFII